MKIAMPAKEDLYYTKEHEWIDFQGPVAYIGICNCKLAGFKQIQEISFKEPSGFKMKGEVIGIVRNDDFQVEAHMPVDGKVLQVNEKLTNGNPNILLDCAESSGWIALIVPSQPHERRDLMLPERYQLTGKSDPTK